MKTKTKSLTIGFVTLFIILIVGAIGNFDRLIASDQYFVLAFGSMGAFNVLNAMVRLKEDTILKRHRVIITSFLLAIIGVVIVVFSVIKVDFNYKFLVVLAIILGSLLIPLADWNAKRNQESKKANNC